MIRLYSFLAILLGCSQLKAQGWREYVSPSSLHLQFLNPAFTNLRTLNSSNDIPLDGYETFNYQYFNHFWPSSLIQGFHSSMSGYVRPIRGNLGVVAGLSEIAYYSYSNFQMQYSFNILKEEKRKIIFGAEGGLNKILFDANEYIFLTGGRQGLDDIFSEDRTPFLNRTNFGAGFAMTSQKHIMGISIKRLMRNLKGNEVFTNFSSQPHINIYFQRLLNIGSELKVQAHTSANVFYQDFRLETAPFELGVSLFYKRFSLLSSLNFNYRTAFNIINGLRYQGKTFQFFALYHTRSRLTSFSKSPLTVGFALAL